MSTSATRHTLTIKEAELDDQSEYTIVVEEGVESTAKLKVEGRGLSLSYIT